MKKHGQITAQHGKNHFGDHDHHLPTNHGFDEFFGNLYHLDAEEEPESYYYPKDAKFRARFGPRGVIHSSEDGEIADTGRMTRKCMETADQKFLAASVDFIKRAHDQDRPISLWHNSTRMHMWTHLKPRSRGVTGIGLYPDRMVEHDGQVGVLLDLLAELGIADSTIVMHSADKCAETVSWPDGSTTPLHGEKGTTWEGGFRVPLIVKWPGLIEPGARFNGIVSHDDWMPTFATGIGEKGLVGTLIATLEGGINKAGRFAPT